MNFFCLHSFPTILDKAYQQRPFWGLEICLLRCQLRVSKIQSIINTVKYAKLALKGLLVIRSTSSKVQLQHSFLNDLQILFVPLFPLIC